MVLRRCVLTSPKGQVFNTEFIKSVTSGSLRVQEINHPAVDGTQVAVHGSNGRRYSLTHYFYGPGALDSAHLFENAVLSVYDNVTGSGVLTGLLASGIQAINIFKTGRWQMLHPTRGLIDNLVPVSIEVRDAPVESANICEVQVEWAESLPDATLAPALGIAGKFANGLKKTLKLVADTGAAISQIRNTLGAVFSILNSFVDAAGDTAQKMNDAVTYIGSLVADGQYSAELILTAIENVLTLPDTVDAMGDTINSRAKSINNACTRIFTLQAGDEPAQSAYAKTELSGASYNNAVLKAFCMACLMKAAAAQVMRSSFGSREESLDFIQNMTNFETLYKRLENIEKLAEANYADVQFSSEYFGADLKECLALARGAAASGIYSMPVTRKVTLTDDTPTLEFAMREMASDAVSADADYEQFLKENKLVGSEVFLLRKGRTVTIPNK